MTFREWIETGRQSGYLDRFISVDEKTEPRSGMPGIVGHRLTVRIGNRIFEITEDWPAPDPNDLLPGRDRLEYAKREAWRELEAGIGRWLRGEPDPKV